MMAYVYAGVAAVVLALAGATWVQTQRLDALRAEYEGFKAKVEVLGREAQKKADQEYADAIKDKEAANAENKRTTAALNDAVARLRAQRSGRNFLPSPAPAAGHPDIASFDRAELERAIRDFDAGAAGIAAKGSKAVIDLDTAKGWAKSLR